MSKQTANNLFIDSSRPGFYQQLLIGIGSFQELGNRIISKIKAAHAFRQVEEVRELSRLLLNIPIKEYQLIAQYYVVWCQCREMKLHDDVLESIVDKSQTYRTKAFLSLAGFAELRRNFELELYFLKESLKTKPTVSDYIQAIRAMGIVKAAEGFHTSAIRDLESLIPIIRHADPLVYYDFLNSYAVELGEVSRKEEARYIIRHVLASPFAPAYPEWQETARDLKEPNRSFVAFRFVESKFVKIEPEVTHHASIEAQPELPTKVLAFPAPDSPIQPLREAPRPKKPKRVTSKELGEMDLAQKRETILAAIRSGAVPDREHNKMMFMLGLVKSGPADHLIDLEDDAVLTELIMQWAHMVEPERIAAVMSALRDCKDDLRRSNILDSIIRKAFEYSNRCNVTESEWRLEVECKLPEK